LDFDELTRNNRPVARAYCEDQNDIIINQRRSWTVPGCDPEIAQFLIRQSSNRMAALRERDEACIPRQKTSIYTYDYFTKLARIMRSDVTRKIATK
jgi:hypothetical protein